MVQKTINTLQQQKNLGYKKEFGRFKKFWNILKITNQYHTKWAKKQAQTHINIFKNIEIIENSDI